MWRVRRRQRAIGYVRAGADAGEERAAIAAACKVRGWTLVRVEEERAGGRKPARPGLARSRAQGVRLGTRRRAPAETVAQIGKLRAQGKSLQAIADELNRFRYPTVRGGTKWRPSSVASVLKRVS